ncbi:nardilysin-like [Mytilus galloprovincialis]|uniref:nardilysin-like n=1 Tax=Mytilus galloprovincialis TaxID=29158 RepID=UPI003F7B7DE4
MTADNKRIRMSNCITQSENDDRKYRYISLDNGLRVLLISDLKEGESVVDEDVESEEESEEEEVGDDEMEMDEHSDEEVDENIANSQQIERKSAAALCIGVGSFCNPDNIPGFAHFLEHMVFMGSSKYPGENELDDYISTRGGDTNAWTDTEKTCFYFGVEQKYFYRALDRFANFFISPLFKEDAVDREIEAVDSEFQMNLTDDDSRASQLFSLLARENHVMRMFMIGNAETLRDTPKKQGLNIYSKLRDFYKRLYSAHYMTLAVYSKDTLDKMETHVKDIFSSVPNNNFPRPVFDSQKDPFPDVSFHKIIKVLPVNNIHKLWVSWACPPVGDLYKTKPLDILDALITHEGKGSILSLLKKKTWAVGMTGNISFDGFDFNSTWSWFLFSIKLTPEGFKHYREVLVIVFEYLRMLRENFKSMTSFYEEQKLIAKTNFRWREKIDPLEYVEKVAENMHFFSEEDVLTGRSQFYQYDEKMVKSFLDYMTPEHCNVTLMAKELEELCTVEEKYYKVKYCMEDFDEKLMLNLQNVEKNPELHFPDPNQYIATDFDLKQVKEESCTKYPVLLKEDSFIKIWYKKDSKFCVPKGYIHVHLMSPVTYKTLENATMFDIYINLLTQILNEVTYSAVMADYDFSIDGHKTGMEIIMDGFSHKLPELLKAVMHEVFNLETTEKFYQAICAELKKSYHNTMLRTDELCRSVRFAVLEPVQWTYAEKCLVVNSLSKDFVKFMKFVKEFQSKLFIEAFVNGNFTPEEALSYADIMTSHMSGEAVPHDHQFKLLLREVPKSSYYCQQYSHNLSDANSTLAVYLQSEPGTFHTNCLNQLLQARMKEPCFDTLRTKHQLGYEVYSQNLVTNGILGMSIVVEFQAHKFSMLEVDNHITKFLEDFNTTIDDMTETEFSSLVASLIVVKQTEDSNLGEEASRSWKEILEQLYVFDILEKEISVLRTISLDSFKSWFKQYLPKEHRRISFQVLGHTEQTTTTTADIGYKDIDCVKSKGYPCISDKNFSNIKHIDDIEAATSNWTILPLTKITS